MSNNCSEQQIIAEAIKNTVTPEDVVIVAQKYTNDKSVRVLSYHIDDYSEGTLGFAGSHRNLKVTFQKSNAAGSEIVNFFVKSVPYQYKELADFLKEQGLFVKESSFFSKLIPELTNNCQSGKWYPTCYLAKEDSIILEDLRSDGYRLLGKMFDDTLALKSVLASLARLHSCSILMEGRINRNRQHPVTLDQYYPGLFDETLIVRTGKIVGWFISGANVACALAKKLGYNPEKIRKAYNKLYDLLQPSKIHRNVICHGDPWTNNIMFADDAPLYRCVLVDYQILRYVPLVCDLLQFLHLNATQSYRDKYERDLVTFYHSVLEETIKSNDPESIVKVPTLEEIFVAMDDYRLIGLVTASLYFPITLMDAEVAAELTKDSDAYNNFIFGERLDSTLTHMKVNEFYKNKIEEAVIELAEKADSLFE